MTKPNIIQRKLLGSMDTLVSMSQNIDIEKHKDNIDEFTHIMSIREQLMNTGDSEKIKSIGFTAATTQSQSKIVQYDKRIAQLRSLIYNNNCALGTIEFISRMKQYFGEESILVPMDDFEKICNKYNLTCGLFSEYTGYIPDEKVARIQEIQEKILLMDIYWQYKIYTLHRIVGIGFNALEYNNPKYIIAKTRFNSIFPFIEYNNINAVFVGDSCNIFICAPKKYMKNAPKTRINYEDPFICAYTMYGIMILTSWDLEDSHESNDNIIKIHRMIQNKITSLLTNIRKQIE